MTITLPHEWARIHAKRGPEATAIVFDATTLSYGDLDRRADEQPASVDRELR